MTHVRRGDYEFACRCKLMHSDEEALAAGWHLSGETRNHKRLAWGGLASLFRDDVERYTEMIAANSRNPGRTTATPRQPPGAARIPALRRAAPARPATNAKPE